MGDNFICLLWPWLIVVPTLSLLLEGHNLRLVHFSLEKYFFMCFLTRERIGWDGIVGYLTSNEAYLLWVVLYFQVMIYTHEDEVI